MYCKDCTFGSGPLYGGFCSCSNHEKLTENDYSVKYQSEGNRLIYSYGESGMFYVEDYFGCVHFKSKESATWKDFVNQAELLQKRVSAIETALRKIRENCSHSNLPKRELGEQYMDVCQDCGFVNYCYML